jgi:hypothetical protein
MAERASALAAVRRLPTGYLEVLGWWLISRAIVFAAALALYTHGGHVGYFGAATFSHPFGALESWDGRWYTMVAARGYLLVPGRQSDPAFFPLYPLLLRLAHATGIGLQASGLVLSNLILPAALLALYELGRHFFPEAVARRAAVYAAVFPMGFVFSMVYPQSLALLAIALACLLALRHRFGAAAVLAAVAALARPEGLFVALPLATIALRALPELDAAARGRAVAAVAAAPVALLTYPLYLGWALHDSGAWGHAQQAWGRTFAPAGLLHAIDQLPSKVGLNPWLARDAIMVAVYAALVFLAARAGTPRAWLVAGSLVLLVPLLSGSVASEARFGLLAPPLYWGLATLGSTARRDRVIRSGCLILLAAGTLTLPYIFP